jgi:hypothetical protein
MGALADRVRALLALLGPLGAGTRALLLRLIGRFGWKTVLAGAAVAVFAAVRYRTWIVWMIAAWCIAAWMHAPTAGEDADEEAESHLVDPHHAYVQWLLDTIGKQPGIHLQDLYPKMRELPGQEGRSDAELRGALKTLAVPVHRSLRIGRVAGRSGVRRDDVEALLHRLGERRVDFDGDAGQGADSPPLSGVGEGA